MSDILAKLGELFTFIEGMFVHLHVLSLLIGTGVGMGLTQCAKYPLHWHLVHSPDGTPQRTRQEQQLRWSVRLFAVASTAIATYFTWPDDNALWVALANGGACPAVYLVVVKCVGRWAPWLSVTRGDDDPPVL